ncbi:MOSC N-terminal beta barrel domain-containing protein, partial [Rhizobium johnstonii]|uniref:MOSC N-terminal beta barrel domain-containing protein n=1 Tax=Rhizobium johnstonii TaxID=3019933 RepID=UPI003F977725
MRVSDLFIYPLTSARGIALPAADIDAEWLPCDRRAIITDAQGHCSTQRELPDLARIEARPEAS